MSKQRRSFTHDYKEQVGRMVVQESRAIPSTAREIGVNAQILRNWVTEYRKNYATEGPPMTVSERARLREL
jgi:transposase